MSIFGQFKDFFSSSASDDTTTGAQQTNDPAKADASAEHTEAPKAAAEHNDEAPKAAAATAGATHVHNLIILDESGSMISIYNPALMGVNETLQTIRSAQDEHPDQTHTVTLVAFDTTHFNYIYRNTPALAAVDIKPDQYRPNGGTPLYDAMGCAINELHPLVKKGDVVLVTIITDGYENASREFNGRTIRRLVEAMKKEGWVFTYIGANQDVDAVADSMAINNRMGFEATEMGTRAMFEREKGARLNFFNRVSKRKDDTEDLSDGYFD